MAQLIEQNSKCPHVTLLCVVGAVLHFWCHVVLRSTVLGLRDSATSTKAEIANFDALSFIEEQVLRFEIPVHEAVFVQKNGTRNSANKEVECIIFYEHTSSSVLS